MSTIGAFGGEARYMEWVGKGAAQQGTFNGNPLSSAAGLAALTQVLTKDAYDHLGKLGTQLAEGCDRAIAESGIPAHTVDLGAKGCVSYRSTKLTNYRDFLETLTELYWASYPWMVNRGIFMTPGDEEQWTISVQHTEDDIQTYIDAFGSYCQELASLPTSERGSDRNCGAGLRAGPSRWRRDRADARVRRDTEELARPLMAYASRRIANPAPLDGPAPAAELAGGPGDRSPGGRRGRGSAPRLGRGARAGDDLDRPPGVPRVRAGRAVQGERALRPGDQRVLDLAAGAGSRAAGRLGGEPGAAWIADLAGLPKSAGGVFVSGGTAGNLSALVAARHAAGVARGERPARWAIAAGDSAHSSVLSAAAR